MENFSSHIIISTYSSGWLESYNSDKKNLSLNIWLTLYCGDTETANPDKSEVSNYSSELGRLKRSRSGRKEGFLSTVFYIATRC